MKKQTKDRLMGAFVSAAIVAAFTAFIVGVVYVIVANVSVYADCHNDRGVVVRNYWNWPVCIEKGQH